MGVKLLPARQYGGRFEFVFYIEQAVGGDVVSGRAEIYEYSRRLAVLALSETTMSRLEVADELVVQCVRWADAHMAEHRPTLSPTHKQHTPRDVGPLN